MPAFHLHIISAASLATAGLVAAAPALAQPVVPSAPYQAVDLPLITVAATGEVQSKPDMATIGTGIETQAPTAREAMAQNAAKMEKLVSAMVKAGIERKYIRTSSINLNARYDYSTSREGQPPRFLGYQASNQVQVEIRDLDRVGELIDTMVANGANNLNGPSFGFKDDAALLMQARGKALKAAKERADYYAAQAGYRTVRLVSITEGGGGQMPFPMPVAMMEAKQDSGARTVVEPGQLSTSVSLNVQYVMER